MRCVSVVFLTAGWGLSQSPADLFSKAPPDVDEALRARVKVFFDLGREGKFRRADELVAEDSKDQFFEMEKRRCQTWELDQIKYSDKFSKAQVQITCDTEMFMPPAGRMPVRMPVRSTWKVVEGQWYFYLEPLGETRMTPFGPMRVSKPEDVKDPRASLPGFNNQPNLEHVRKAARLSKGSIILQANQASTDYLEIAHALPGELELSLVGPKVDGLEMKIDPPKLKGGQKGRITFTFKPVGPVPRAVDMTVRIESTGQSLPFMLNFMPN